VCRRRDGLDVQRAARILYTPPDHGKTDVTRLDRARRIGGIDADAVVADLEYRTSAVGPDRHVDAGRARMLDCVYDEFLSHGQQQRAGEKRPSNSQWKCSATLSAAGNGATAARSEAANPSSRTWRDGTRR
jgi:hypothetical protein